MPTLSRCSFAAPAVIGRPAVLRHAAHRAALLLGVAIVAAACGGRDAPVTPTGPVTLTFAPLIFTPTNGGPPDTVRGIFTLDGTTTVALTDTIRNVARGRHTVEIRSDADYLVQRYEVDINPSGSELRVPIQQEGTCRQAAFDRQFCIEGVTRRNVLRWSRHPRVYCPTNDFGEWCARSASDEALGGAWPSDSTRNAYIERGRLLLAGTVGPELGSVAGARIATAFDTPGDYSPRQRLTVASGDSSRYVNEVWTDARYLAIFPERQGRLPVSDRRNARFGLSVRVTYFLPESQPDAIFARYDVMNISNHPDYIRVHPGEPADGHVMRDIYLVPTIDADVGGPGGGGAGEFDDDNVTAFPDDSLVATYDAALQVPNFTGGYAAKPGLVGLRLVSGPPGTTARALLFDADRELNFATSAAEAATYAVLLAGRGAAVPGCTASTAALVCGDLTETPGDYRMAWSVGPVASLAPGQSTSITVALLFAQPTPGTFTSGTTIAPQNGELASTTRPIYGIAALLRALGASTAGTVVTPVPR